MANLYIGLMSGTSVDGIDAVLVDFSDDTINVIAAQNFSISHELGKQLLAFNQPANNELENYANCDVLLGRLFAQSASALLEDAGYTGKDIIAIGSHGQTIRHYPHGITPTTLQIGDPNIIAEVTGITTVADFRRRDMAAGGQGAPLVPAFHEHIFRQSEEERGILNLGGIANLTLLPADIKQPAIGFDTGPANCLLNDWIQHCRQLPFDESGQWAASGTINQSLLDDFLSDAYFSQPIPKSTGRDYFRLDWIEHFLQTKQGLNNEDVQATLAELTAISIANDMHRYMPQVARLFICGGGVHNHHLYQRLQTLLPTVTIESTVKLGIEPDFVEATAFAWFAKQTLAHQQSSLCSVTGARGNRILGGIYQA